MNLVKLITDQLSSDTLAKLASLLGVDSETVESTVAAAVPSMLAGLGGLVSKEDGVRKLSATLGSLDDTMFGNFDRLLGGDTGALLQKGSGLIDGLFGDTMSSNLTTALSRFTGLNSSTVKSLLAYLTPLVLGRVASQWRNQGGTPGALKTLFADQKRHIEDALPSGIAPEDIPGFSRAIDARSDATRAATGPAPTKPLASTLLPLALLIAGALVLWSYFHNRQQPQLADEKPALDASEEVVAMKPVVPDASQMKQQWTDLVTGILSTFAEIKDGTTAGAALPQLEEIDKRIDTLRESFDSLPAASQAGLGTFMKDQIATAKSQATRVRSLPGLPDEIKTLVDQIVRKLDELIVTAPTT